MKGWLQYAAVWLLLKGLGLLPRSLARWVAAKVAVILYTLSPKLRKTAETNLRMAFQEWTETQRAAVIRKMVRNLGWMAAEFARIPKYSVANIEEIVVLDGNENFLDARKQRNGVLILTGHIGAW